MSYYNPSFDPNALSVFSVTKLTISLDDLSLHENPKNPMAIFDFPKDLSVMIDDQYIPGNIFDYFSPLLVTKELIASGKIGFSRVGEIQSLRSFDCLQLKGDGMDSVLKMAMKGIIFYPGNYYINYKTMTVSLTGKSRQLWELLDNMNSHEEVSSWIPMDTNQMLSLQQLIQQAFVGNPLVLAEEEDDE